MGKYNHKDKNNVDNDDFCFLAGGWDPKPDNGEQNESVVSLDPAAMLSLKKNVGTHLSIDQATVALGKFVDALFNRSLNAFQTNKAAEQWCVCRGMPASKGSVVLAVARHLKDVVSPHNRRERNLEISQRLEQTFPTEATEATKWLVNREGGGPVYLRFGKAGEPTLTGPDSDPWEFGKLRYLRRGEDVAVLSYGVITKMAAEVADALTEDGNSVGLYESWSQRQKFGAARTRNLRSP